MIVAGLQELAARATIFLPGYDQRLSSDTVVGLHEVIAKARRRVCPKPAFSFKTRKAPPEPLAALIAQVRREVGTTSAEEHLQVTLATVSWLQQPLPRAACSEPCAVAAAGRRALTATGASAGRHARRDGGFRAEFCGS